MNLRRLCDIARLRQTVILAYPPATTDATLRRHRRLAHGVLKALAFCGVTLMASALEAVVDRAPSTLTMIVLVASAVTGLVLALPGLFAACWAKEAEEEMARRGLLDERTESSDRTLGRAAMKMFFYGILIFLILHFFPLPLASPYAAP